MNKLGRYDALQLQKALDIIMGVYEYNYIPSSPLTKKTETVINKIENILATELEDYLQKEYEKDGKIR